MSTSYARERLARITTQLEARAASESVVESWSTSQHDVEEYAAELRHGIQRLRQLAQKRHGGKSDNEKLLKVARKVKGKRDRAAQQQTGGDVAGLNSSGVKTLEELFAAYLAQLVYTATTEMLMDDASRVDYEIDYWTRVQDEQYEIGLYLLQSRFLFFVSIFRKQHRTYPFSSFFAALPWRVKDVFATILRRLHEYSPTQQARDLLSFHTLEHAFRLPPSLLLSSLFPHLATTRDKASSSSTSTTTTSKKLEAEQTTSTRGRLLLTRYSPFYLTRHEASIKKDALQSARDELAVRIGILAAASTELTESAVPLSHKTLSTIGKSLTTTLDDLDDSSEPELPKDAASTLDYLHDFLETQVPSYRTRMQISIIQTNSQPGLITRAWPVVVSVPIVTYLLANKLYKERFAIREWAQMASDTIRGFFVGWVVEPAVKILETVRHGEGGSLAIMGRESLKSDFDVCLLFPFLMPVEANTDVRMVVLSF
jgi:nuclear-control-of-ATPase protein 2